MGEIRWLSVPQAARRIGLSPARTRALAASGIIPAVKTGTSRTSRWRITEQALNGYIREHLRPDHH